MTFEIEIGGRVRRVQVEADAAAPGRFRLHIDDDLCDVDVRETDLGVTLVYRTDGRSAEVALGDPRMGEWVADVGGVSVSVRLDGRRGGRAGSGDSRTGTQRVTAPMPGRIVRVLVKPGDAVVPRQGLVVVEAMKMENELRAARAGTVLEVAAVEGASVEAGRLLVVVE